MIVVAQRRPVQPWVAGKVKISGHAIERALERMREKFESATWVRACKMLERAVRHPEAPVVPIDHINDGKLQVAVPVMDHGDKGQVLGYLSVGSDVYRAGVVATTWLEPWMVDGIVERLRKQRFEISIPRWWDAFSRNPDEPDFRVDKNDQTG